MKFFTQLDIFLPSCLRPKASKKPNQGVKSLIRFSVVLLLTPPCGYDELCRHIVLGGGVVPSSSGE